MMMQGHHESKKDVLSLADRIYDCLEESDIDRKIQLFNDIIKVLPSSIRPNISSLMTDDYIDLILYKIEEQITI
jgi:hypothetical protein